MCGRSVTAMQKTRQKLAVGTVTTSKESGSSDAMDLAAGSCLRLGSERKKRR